MQKRLSQQKPQPNAQSLSQGLQYLSAFVVPSSGVCFVLHLLIFFLKQNCCSFADFQTFSRQHRHKTYILKPDSSCQGKGIWLTKNPAKVTPHEDMVCQVYLSKVRPTNLMQLPDPIVLTLF